MIQHKDCDSISLSLIHVCEACDDVEMGRIRNIFLIKPGTKVSIPLDLEEWTSAIEAGNIIAVPGVRGSSDGGSPITGDGYGDATERLLGYDYTLNISDPAYKDNSDFWQSAERRKWNMAYCTDTLLHYTDRDVTIKTTEAIEEGADSEVVWNVEAKFRTKDKPVKTPKSPIASLLGCFEITGD